MADRDESPGRTLLLAVAAMAGVALLVGLAIGGVVLAAVGTSDVGEGEVAADEAPQTMVLPKYSPTEPAGDEWDLPSYEPSPTPKIDLGEAEEEGRGDRITLFVAPQRAGPGERINFNGVYRDGEGATLQIQRQENGVWTDFPVTATVRGGSFSTWIQTSRTGEAKFRVFDPSLERASNVVKITIG
ncbi:MAG TPA: hypothetical protein VFG72_02445 [Marmoricola sp.]|nr:hypothetical protein [Marmoricola sp.]